MAIAEMRQLVEQSKSTSFYPSAASNREDEDVVETPMRNRQSHVPPRTPLRHKISDRPLSSAILGSYNFTTSLVNNMPSFWRILAPMGKFPSTLEHEVAEVSAELESASSDDQDNNIRGPVLHSPVSHKRRRI